MTIRRLSPILLTAAIALPAAADDVPVDSSRWKFEAKEHRVEEHLGRQALFLQGGIAYVEGSDLTDGTFEFDIAFPPDPAFVGAIWRMEDPENHEEFYMRPHQSGNPDANQYTPVFHGLAGWQLYYGESYSAPTQYRFDAWMHVRIAVSGSRAEVYIIDMDEPALFIPELKRKVRGGPVGLFAASQGPAWFAGFRFTPGAVALKGSGTLPAPAPAGTVLSWQVSNSFDAAVLTDREVLDPAEKDRWNWTKLDCEPTGLANLARVQGIAPGHQAAFARVTLASEVDQVKRVSFGFSDAVQVYLNGRALFSGNDRYRTRDYRFLGTIGYYDVVHLPLRAGENELWFAVVENFGGWGLQARLDDPDGVRILP